MRALSRESLAGSALAGLTGGGLILAAVSMASSIAERSRSPVEAVSGTLVGLAVGGVALVAVGVVLFALSRNRDIVLLSAAALLLLVLAVAGLFSIGLLLLPFAAFAGYLLFRRAAGRRGLAPALIAGPALAIGLSLLFVVWVQPPLVECGESGVTTHSRPWWGSGSSSGEGSASVESGVEVSQGSIDTPTARYVYTCRGDELTRFRRIGGS